MAPVSCPGPFSSIWPEPKNKTPPWVAVRPCPKIFGPYDSGQHLAALDSKEGPGVPRAPFSWVGNSVVFAAVDFSWPLLSRQSAINLAQPLGRVVAFMPLGL